MRGTSMLNLFVLLLMMSFAGLFALMCLPLADPDYRDE